MASCGEDRPGWPGHDGNVASVNSWAGEAILDSQSPPVTADPASEVDGKGPRLAEPFS